MPKVSRECPADRKTYIITGPTSGIGRAAALEVAKHGTVVLVGRDRQRLEDVRRTIETKGRSAVSVVCDLSDIFSVRRATSEIIALNLPIVGLLNNAGIMQMRPTKTARGWDMSFATNHLGPFALTEALVPHLPDGATVVFVASAVEDPERKPAVAAGFRGGRYVSPEASARREWQPGDAKRPGFDAYATSKQCTLATALAFARETPRLHFNAIEPGVNPTTALSRDGGVFVRFLSKYIIPLLAAAHALHKDPEHAGARCACDRQSPDQRIRANRCLLRRERSSNVWLYAGARLEVPRPCRRGDARFAVVGFNLMRRNGMNGRIFTP
jgi:NAD(P)-dependent dehydrogenase (short-subunit alcohol dehydrogenase family)